MTIDKLVLPFKQRLETRGNKLYINLCYVAFTNQNAGDTQYIHDDPAEYAEYMLATFNHLKARYGWVPDALDILLEPENVRQWNGASLGNAISKTLPVLNANGYHPDVIVPEGTNMRRSAEMFDQIARIPGAVQYVTELSYHRYREANDTNLQAIVNLAVRYGVNTSMLEWWNSANNYQVLHKDLTLGRNSAWQQGAVLGDRESVLLFYVDTNSALEPSVMPTDVTKYTQQYYRYIHAGAIRIGATSIDSRFDPVAFINTDGSYAVVVKADSGGPISLAGLPAGTYGITYTVSIDKWGVELPDEEIGTGGSLRAEIPSKGVLTVYGKK